MTAPIFGLVSIRPGRDTRETIPVPFSATLPALQTRNPARPAERYPGYRMKENRPAP